MSRVVLGTDVETGQVVRIGDIERRSGFYWLGKMGMGKSAVAINMALQDIANGHGVFFIDPHGDAVIDLLRRGNTDLLKDRAYLLDVEDEDYSFGINLLQCPNVASWKARNATYTRVYNVFNKLWEDQWGPWLQLILQNVLWAFIENQGYTLADVPTFLNSRNTTFREHIIGNIKYNPAVADFWRFEFSERSERSQQERDESALTRIHTLLTYPSVRHIIGQAQTTIDFSSILATNKVILLKLSANLAEDAKKFIGTILLSELVHAVRNRLEDERSQFCVFIDEFHNFASTDHMAIMTNEGRKFGVAATYLHVERFGQLAHNQKLMGATQAIVNKGMFQATRNDADEFAPEFAKDSATEIRERRRLVISQEPFQDLLRGHTNPEIRAFVNRYLRPLPYRMEDTQAEIEAQRMKRLDYLDEAALDRIDLQLVTDGVSRHQIASAATKEVQLAKNQTADMLTLHHYAQGLRHGLRELNHFFTALMEGQIAPGQGAFSAFLVDRVSTFSAIRPTLIPVLQLYISLTYGDPQYSPPLPFTFAKEHGFFLEMINAIQQDEEEKIRREQETLKKEALEECKRKEIGGIEAHKRMIDKSRANDWQDFSYPIVDKHTVSGIKAIRQPMDFEHSEVKSVYFGFLKEYKRIYHNSRFMTLLSPYFTARFAEPWASGFPPYRETSSGLLEVIRQERELTLSEQRPKSFWKSRKEPRISPYFRNEAYPETPPRARYELDYLDEAEQFVRNYQEGALVVYALLMTLEKPLRWRRFYRSGCLLDRLNMMHLPTLVNREPFEVFLLLAKLDELIPDYKHEFTRRISNWEEPIDSSYADFNGGQLSVLLAQSHDERVKQGWWRNSEKPVQTYLMGRAYHIMINGESVANQTFPHPTLQGISSDEVANMVSFMVNLLQEEKERRETKLLQQLIAIHEKRIQENIDKRYIGKPLPIPTHLPTRSLSPTERETIRQACLTELVQNGHGAVIQVIADFVQFCELLARPENHVRTQSSQFVEIEVNTYPTQEMINQMAKEIGRLPSYQAYVKLIDNNQNEQIVRTHRIKTRPLPEITNTHMVAQAIANGHTLGKDRDAIEEEIQARQARWLQAKQPPPTAKERRRKPQSRPKASLPPSRQRRE